MLKQAHKRKRNVYRDCLNSLFLATVSTLLTTTSVGAAEKIYAAFGPLDFSLSVTDLENYVKTGKVTPELKFLTKRLNPKQQEELRTALQKSYDVKALTLSRAFYAPMGENILQRIGKIIQTGTGQNGKFALRAALVQAAAEGDFTLIKVLKKFPTPGIRINTSETITAIKKIAEVFADTPTAIAEINKLSQAEIAAAPPINYKQLADIRTSGSATYASKTIYLQDTSRDRKYPVDLYLPPANNNSREPIPVVVISHGFSDSRSTFTQLAKFLASHGFAVALPEHIGSNFDQREATLAGRGRELFRLNEFIDRPLDVTFLLNYLEGLNQSEFQGRLNLQKVGIIGHSFGGYTALMLGGATVDFEQLTQDCQEEPFNISSLLQCRAREFKPSSMQRKILSQGLRDPRIQLIIALNPVSSIILGQKGLSRIQVPVVMGSAGYDPATPVVGEQIRAFTWLQTPNKYLVLADGFSHTTELTTLLNSLFYPPSASAQLADEVKIFQQNARIMMLAFLQVYIAERSQYRPYIQPSYAQFINESESPFKFSMIRSLNPEQWKKILQGVRE
ncbi:MAG: alpha/beta hydrolase [Calothrix sp. MO_167.B12]|nr:alpha/beta hydrolase [Calothrix sp. MO_167.B12]